jgi:hypothetical protein
MIGFLKKFFPKIVKPKYPIYVPSKDRSRLSHTVNFFLEDGVDFKIVVEPSQEKAYVKKFGRKLVLTLPEDNLRLLGARLWIREHSIANGHKRHWQIDDNIRYIGRLHKGERIRCNANKAMHVIEDFTDRYENVGVSGLNYRMFVARSKFPYIVNTRVYSASLINNEMPYKHRLYYNDDTDLCLQCVTNGLCTINFNTFFIEKITTMKVKGGNTTDLYEKDGRLLMARTLEEVWGKELVETKIRFGRPQHVIRNSWKDFTHPLIRRKDIDWDEIKKRKYNFKLNKDGRKKN